MNGGNLMDKDPFKEYMKQSEPNKRDKGYAWHTAIGLQAVDGLKTSKYLIEKESFNAESNIKNVIHTGHLSAWRWLSVLS